MSKERLDKNTEQKILDAAKEVFLLKGYEGARMQQIAEKAGINKALLHYYFRSKEKLFEGIFQDAIINLLSRMGEIISSVLPLQEKVEYFIENYMEFLQKHPYLPMFVVQELNRKPESILQHFNQVGNFPDQVEKLFEEEIEKGNIRKVSPRHILSNIISMLLFPFIAKPILQQVMFKGNQEEYQEFLKERKKEVSEFVLESLKP